ncbi:hypothetical protein [Actinoplanes sp. L3-i22]|uniref:hypothetical protein n=1 Tax=Actinoplanes sp. L3-i22 TaxID=2836373 RepID=UPI00210414D0|nr:hypothetical protein [Actinoplanes sp. L3-i22]
MTHELAGGAEGIELQLGATCGAGCLFRRGGGRCAGAFGRQVQIFGDLRDRATGPAEFGGDGVAGLAFCV